jgi:uncharacterized membrane protein YuzA (DUF378 family)
LIKAGKLAGNGSYIVLLLYQLTGIAAYLAAIMLVGDAFKHGIVKFIGIIGYNDIAARSQC